MIQPGMLRELQSKNAPPRLWDRPHRRPAVQLAPESSLPRTSRKAPGLRRSPPQRTMIPISCAAARSAPFPRGRSGRHRAECGCQPARSLARRPPPPRRWALRPPEPLGALRRAATPINSKSNSPPSLIASQITRRPLGLFAAEILVLATGGSASPSRRRWSWSSAPVPTADFRGVPRQTWRTMESCCVASFLSICSRACGSRFGIKHQEHLHRAISARAADGVAGSTPRRAAAEHQSGNRRIAVYSCDICARWLARRT